MRWWREFRYMHEGVVDHPMIDWSIIAVSLVWQGLAVYGLVTVLARFL